MISEHLTTEEAQAWVSANMTAHATLKNALSHSARMTMVSRLVDEEDRLKGKLRALEKVEGCSVDFIEYVRQQNALVSNLIKELI